MAGETFLMEERGEGGGEGGGGIIAGPMKFIFLCNDIDTHSVSVAAIYDIIERVFPRMETRESVLESAAWRIDASIIHFYYDIHKR